MSEIRSSEAIREGSDRDVDDSEYRANWWHVVAAICGLAVARLVVGVTYSDPLSTPTLLLGASGLLAFLAFATPIAIYLDLRYVADIADRSPNRRAWTAAAALAAAAVYGSLRPPFLLVPIAICAAYLAVRHRRVPLVA